MQARNGSRFSWFVLLIALAASVVACAHKPPVVSDSDVPSLAGDWALVVKEVPVIRIALDRNGDVREAGINSSFLFKLVQFFTFSLPDETLKLDGMPHDLKLPIPGGAIVPVYFTYQGNARTFKEGARETCLPGEKLQVVVDVQYWLKVHIPIEGDHLAELASSHAVFEGALGPLLSDVRTEIMGALPVQTTPGRDTKALLELIGRYKLPFRIPEAFQATFPAVRFVREERGRR